MNSDDRIMIRRYKKSSTHNSTFFLLDIKGFGLMPQFFDMDRGQYSGVFIKTRRLSMDSTLTFDLYLNETFKEHI